MPGANGDPLLGALPPLVPALHWNEDVFDLPHGAVELLGPRLDGVEAFRAGPNAYGLQVHPEVDPSELDRWYVDYGGWLTQAGVTELDARDADAAHVRAQADAAARLFTAFAGIVGDATCVIEVWLERLYARLGRWYVPLLVGAMIVGGVAMAASTVAAGAGYLDVGLGPSLRVPRHLREP